MSNYKVKSDKCKHDLNGSCSYCVDFGTSYIYTGEELIKLNTQELKGGLKL